MGAGEARLLNHSFIGTEHILLGLIREGDGIGARALQSLGISLEAVREKVEETIGMSANPPTSPPPFTPRAKKVLELSFREALQLHHNYIGTEHLLLGLVREHEGVACTILVNLGADLPRVRRAVTELMSGVGQEPETVGQAHVETPSTQPLPPQGAALPTLSLAGKRRGSIPHRCGVSRRRGCGSIVGGRRLLPHVRDHPAHVQDGGAELGECT